MPPCDTAQDLRSTCCFAMPDGKVTRSVEMRHGGQFWTVFAGQCSKCRATTTFNHETHEGDEPK